MESEKQPLFGYNHSSGYPRPTDVRHSLLTAPDLSMVDYSLYVGNYESAKVAKQYGLKAVLTVTNSPLERWHKTSGIDYFFVKADDKRGEDLLSLFQPTYQWIADCVDTNRPILVDCRCGVSRSATIVCAYLMKRHKLSAEDAMNWLSGNRPIVRPNRGFRRQLELFQKMDYNYNASDERVKRFWSVSSTLL